MHLVLHRKGYEVGEEIHTSSMHNKYRLMEAWTLTSEYEGGEIDGKGKQLVNARHGG